MSTIAYGSCGYLAKPSLQLFMLLNIDIPKLCSDIVDGAIDAGYDVDDIPMSIRDIQPSDILKAASSNHTDTTFIDDICEWCIDIGYYDISENVQVIHFTDDMIAVPDNFGIGCALLIDDSLLYTMTPTNLNNEIKKQLGDVVKYDTWVNQG